MFKSIPRCGGFAGLYRKCAGIGKNPKSFVTSGLSFTLSSCAVSGVASVPFWAWDSVIVVVGEALSAMTVLKAAESWWKVVGTLIGHDS